MKIANYLLQQSCQGNCSVRAHRLFYNSSFDVFHNFSIYCYFVIITHEEVRSLLSAKTIVKVATIILRYYYKIIVLSNCALYQIIRLYTILFAFFRSLCKLMVNIKIRRPDERMFLIRYS